MSGGGSSFHPKVESSGVFGSQRNTAASGSAFNLYSGSGFSMGSLPRTSRLHTGINSIYRVTFLLIQFFYEKSHLNHVNSGSISEEPLDFDDDVDMLTGAGGICFIDFLVIIYFY